jgi:putative flippase GtrA
MFLRFFRSCFATQYIAIGIIGILLWSRAFFEPPGMPAPDGPVPLYALIYALLHGSPRAASMIGFILTLLSAFLLNRLLTSNEVVLKNSSLSALIFIALMSYFPFLLTLHQLSIATFILLMILERLYKSYSKSESLELTYVAGFLIGIASLFYLPFILFFFFLLISFIIFRNIDWHEWVGSFIGLATPYIFLSVYYFWFDEWMIKAHEYQHFFMISFDPAPFREPTFLILSGIVLVLLVLGLITGLSRLSEKTIEIRKKTILLIWLIPVMILSIFFSASLLKYHLLISFITLSGFLSVYLLKIRNTFWQELIFVGLLVILLLNNLLSGLL